MRHGFSALIIALLFGVTACGGETHITPLSEGQHAGSLTGITVTGIGEVLGEPDTLTFTIGVQLTRDTVSDALDDAATKAEAVIDTLADEGVDPDDIQTANFSIYPEYDWSERGRRLLGYSVSNTVLATVRNVDTAGDVLDAAVRAGGDDTVVQGIGFSIEDDAERLEAARVRAWADAEAKAVQLADLAGVGLGAATRVSEGVHGSSPFDVSGSADMVFEDAARTPFEPGQVTTRVVLTVVFAVS